MMGAFMKMDGLGGDFEGSGETFLRLGTLETRHFLLLCPRQISIGTTTRVVVNRRRHLHNKGGFSIQTYSLLSS